ncbi:SCO3933 family regulatory protein [Streptomyces sp. NPDC001415]
MPSFKIDTSTAVVFVAVEPKFKVINKQTEEVAVDRETGAKMMTVGLTVADEGEANLLSVSVPETGVPDGTKLGMPVKVVGLKARDWENTFNGEKRFGIAFRAVALILPSASAKS